MCGVASSKGRECSAVRSVAIDCPCSQLQASEGYFIICTDKYHVESPGIYNEQCTPHINLKVNCFVYSEVDFHS